MTTLAEQQAALVRALVAGDARPDGFDPSRLEAARRALVRKRAGEVARVWPELMADPATFAAFIDWADGRPRGTSRDEGLAFAGSRDDLSPAARAELHRHRHRHRRRWRWRRR